MKKIYAAPLTEVQNLVAENIIALSLQSGKADSSDALVKGGDWDIFGSSEADLDEE